MSAEMNMNKESNWQAYASDDGFVHHRCPSCKSDAIFTYIAEELWDEDFDGNWKSCGNHITDIDECLTPYCPFCGIKLIEEEENENHK